MCVYTPNAQDGLRRLEYRMHWDDAFREFVCSLDRHKPVVICGDMNVAATEIDLKTRSATSATPASAPRSARNFRSCCMPASRTRSVPCTRTRRTPTRGGATASTRGRTTPAGASTTFCARTARQKRSRQPASFPTFTAATTAPWSSRSHGEDRKCRDPRPAHARAHGGRDRRAISCAVPRAGRCPHLHGNGERQGAGLS